MCREIIGLALGALFCACITGKERPAVTEDGSPADGVARDNLAPPDRRSDGTKPPGTWISLKAGKFKMGSGPEDKCRDASDEVLHWVTLSRGFEISKTEVTQGEFKAVMGHNPAGYKLGDDHPVENVTWHEAVAYCDGLSARAGIKESCYEQKGSLNGCKSSSECSSEEACIAGHCSRYEVSSTYQNGKIYACPGYRLPTEAEWEYAYRAGTEGALYVGNLPDCYVHENADLIAWYDNTTLGEGHKPVGTKQPNEWGLCDMAGNVAEWCNDWYRADLGESEVTDPPGPPAGTCGSSPGACRVQRNGSWESRAGALRASSRTQKEPVRPTDRVGFRCVRSLTP